ncbi:DUF4136 domain-containing protein [Thermaurantiacus sp.]
MRFALLLALLFLAACASGRFAADVTRFHVAPPPLGQTVAVVPLEPADAGSLAFRNPAAAVESELRAVGFRIAPAETAELLAVLGVRQTTREGLPRRSPITIGIGGGTGGGNVGVGGSVAFPVGTPRGREVLRSEMSLALKRRPDGETLWEGRAAATAEGRSPAVDERLLARALLSGYPGPSGRTVRWLAR